MISLVWFVLLVSGAAAVSAAASSSLLLGYGLDIPDGATTLQGSGVSVLINVNTALYPHLSIGLESGFLPLNGERTNAARNPGYEIPLLLRAEATFGPAYVAAGAGIYFNLETENVIDPGVNAGAGLRLFLERSLALELGVRYGMVYRRERLLISASLAAGLHLRFDL